MSNFVKLIKTKGDAIRCEAAPGENGGHAGLIVLVEKDKERAVLGRTDPTFKSAKAAVDKMKETVDAVRNGVPEPLAEEEPVLEATPEPTKEKPRKRRSRKKKGVKDGRTDSEEDDGGAEADGLRRKTRSHRMPGRKARE